MISEDQARVLITNYVERYLNYRGRNNVEAARRMRYECCVVYSLCTEVVFDTLAGV